MLHGLRRLLVWICTIFLMVWIPSFAWFYQLIPTEKFNLPDETLADAVVVLTGAKGRLDEGLQLLKDGHAESLFISGVGEGVKLHELAAVSKVQADEGWLEQVARDGQVMLGRRARSTIGNAEEVVTWMREKHYHSMLLVTSFYHMPRSMFELRTAMPDAVIIPMPVFPEKTYLPAAVTPPIETPEFRILGHNIATWKLIMLEFHKYMIRRVMLATGMEH